MPEEKQKLLTTRAVVTTTTSVVALVASILGLWFLAEDRLNDSIVTSTTNITEMIQRSTKNIVELHHDDLMVRKRIIAIEISERQQAGERVPRILRSELEALKDQITELERKKW